MRWISYFILAYLIIAIQMALTGYLRWGQASPNLVLPAAVFIAINARREQALFGEIGRAQRLNSSHRCISYAVFCLKKKKMIIITRLETTNTYATDSIMTISLPRPRP